MTNQTCRLCKKEKDEQQFLKNGRLLKSCEDCRLIVREAKFLKKQKKNEQSESSSDETVEEPTPVEDVEDVGVEETKEEPVQEPVQETVPDVEPTPVEDVEDIEEEVFEKINKPKRSRKVTKAPQNSPVTPPTKLVLTRTKTVKEKNLPSTKRVKKPRAKKE